MKLYCREGHPYSTKGFQRQPWEVECPECGGRLETGMERNSRSRAGRGLTSVEVPALAEAHLHFSQAVCSWPCWARENRTGHRCWGPVDSHHLAPASWIKQTYRDLPDDELAAILYAVILGCPACRLFHEGLENRSEIIYFEELDPELIDFAQRVDRQYPGRPSLVARLGLESPRKAAA